MRSSRGSGACGPLPEPRLDALLRFARGGASVVSVALLALAASAQGFTDDHLAQLARRGPSQEIPEGGHLGLTQAIRDARNDRVVAVVASHPDDQYVLPATFLRLNEGYRVYAVMMTRGEGGQNSAGPEVGDALAALRTLETEQCARQVGFDVDYVNLPDAGYCRTGAEALELWGRDDATKALATALRRVRPDVVLTTHQPSDTHGHDLAVLQILPDAVALAGDPRFRTPDLEPVRIERLYRGAGDGETPWFALATDDVDPDRGETYRDLAYAALTSAHRSQAPFRASDAFFLGANRFVGVRLPHLGTAPPPELYEGLPDLFADLAPHISADAIAALRRRIDVDLPGLLPNRPRLAEVALELRRDLRAIDLAGDEAAALRLGRRTEALERVALHALGMRADVIVDRAIVVPGETLRFEVVVSSSGLVPVRALALDAAGDGALVPRVPQPANLARPQPWRIGAEIDVPVESLRDHPLHDLFRRSRFAMPLAVRLRFRVAFDDGAGDEFALRVELPIDVRPPVELSVHPKALLVTDGDAPVRFNVRVRRNTTRAVTDRLRVQVPPGFDAEPPFVDLDLQTEPEQGYLFRLRVPTGMRPGPQPVRLRLGDANARVELHRVRVALPRELRVGLVEGVDDASRTVLSQLGCEFEVLTEAGLPTRTLDDLDTILVDIRALRHHAAARAEFNRLLGFAERGGRLVILYHKDTEFDFEQTGQRFFPSGLELRIGKGRTTREDAPIEALLPEHLLLTTPNRIRAEDWDGWTQERGLYFASEWADGYDALLRTADPDQVRQDGALLYAQTGSGEYVYCALALHRQLKNLHPGACRLLANLVAHRRPDR